MKTDPEDIWEQLPCDVEPTLMSDLPGQCAQCAEYAEQLINVANKCCACGELLMQGGWWGWHKEGFRAGPFCNNCTDKPSMERQVIDPSIDRG